MGAYLPSDHERKDNAPLRVVIARGAMYFALWLVLMPSAKPYDLAAGALAAVFATWASLWLLRPEAGRVRFGVLLALLPHFLWQSVLAGVDVARRAFDPRMPMRPGFVDCPLNFPPGLSRNTFATITSLLPGSVPCGDKHGVLVYHCLDITQPAIEQLREEERLFARALIAGKGHD
ncbi:MULTISPECIES: Na+/H+ antiporter subunit E [unclassified Luteimonas]